MHGRADEPLRSPATLSALAALTDGGYVGREDGAALHAAYRVPAHARAPHPARTGCAAPTSCPSDEASLRRLGRSHGLRPASPVAALDAGLAPPPRARCAGCTRSSSTGRCSTRWPGCRPTRRGSPRRRPSSRLRGARLRRPGGRAAPPRGADQRASAGRAAIQRTLLPVMLELVRRRARPGRRPVRLPPGQRGARLDAVVPADCCATRAQVAERLAQRARPPAATPPTCCCARRRRCGCSATTTSCSRAAAGRSTQRCWPPAARHDDPEAAVGAVRARAPPRAVPDRRAADLLRAARRRRGRRRRSSDVTDATLDGGAARSRRRPVRAGAGDALPTRFAVIAMGRLRRRRAGLRQRRRRDVRARARCRAPTSAQARRRRHAVAERAAPAAGAARRPTRRSRSTPTCGPRASTGRWCARLASYARLLRALVGGRGRRRRCCAPRPVAGDADLRRAVHRADRPAALPGRRARRRRRARRSAGSRRGSTTERLPRGADPATAPQARPRRPRRRRVDRAAAAAAARRARCRRCAPPRTLDALAGGGARPTCSRRGRRGAGQAWRTASRLRNAITLVRGRACRPAAPRHPRAAGGRAHPRLPAGGVRPDGQRLPAAPRGAPGGRGAGVLG